MTAPFPTRKQEEWRYADLDALKPIWAEFAEPEDIVVAAGAVDPVGRHVGVVVAHAVPIGAVELMVEDRRGHVVQRRLDLGLVDVEALTGTPPMLEGGEEDGGADAR